MVKSANRRSRRLMLSSSSSSSSSSSLPITSSTTTPSSIFRAATEKLTAVSRRSSQKSSQSRKHAGQEAQVQTQLQTTHSDDAAHRGLFTGSSENKKESSSGMTNLVIRVKNRQGNRQKESEPASDPMGNHSIHRLYPDRSRSPSSDREVIKVHQSERPKLFTDESTDVVPSMIQLGLGEFMHVEHVDLFELDEQQTSHDTEDEEEAFERELEEERKLGLETLYRDVGRILYLDIQAAQTLLSSLILILIQEGPMLDQSLPPEQQSEEAKSRLEALACSICVSIECVQRVSRSWPHVGIWLVTKAFDVWIGRL